MTQPDKVFGNPLRGDDPIIQIQWRMGCVLELWSEYNNHWQPRAGNFDPPARSIYYRLKGAEQS
jgi:hypothetical protein